MGIGVVGWGGMREGGRGQHRIGYLFEQDKLTPGPQVPHLEVGGGGAEGNMQALSSLSRQLRSGVSRAGPSLFCSQAAAPHCANRGRLGEKGPVKGGGGGAAMADLAKARP